MSIEAISAIGVQAAALMPAPLVAAPPQVDFASALGGSLQELNARMLADQRAVTDLATGANDNLHQVMMNLEHTRLSFELTMAVRNKLLESYQELMRMQV
jgi:flagellar hook-basal body complex protein FliE